MNTQIHVLQVGAAPFEPWVIAGKGNDSSVRGVALEIYEAMRKKHVFDYQVQKETPYGGSLVNNKWTGMIANMLKNITDIGGPLFVSEERASAVQYATPLAYSKIGMLSGLVPANKNPYLIFGIFSFEVWLTIFVSIFVAAGAGCVIYSILPAGHSKKKLEAFLRFMWIFMTSLLGQEFGANGRYFLQHIWDARSFKLLQGTWILSCLVLTYTCQGTIISKYAADKMIPKYETLEDILADPKVVFGTFEKSFPFACLSKLANTELDDIWTRAQPNLLNPNADPTWWLDNVEDGKAAYLHDAVSSMYLVGERFRKTGKCGIRVTPIELCASSLALVMRKELPPNILLKVNDGVMRFNEGALTLPYLTESVLFYDICTHASTSTTQPLELTDLLGAFTVLGTGILISMLFLTLELVTGRNRKIQNYEK